MRPAIACVPVGNPPSLARTRLLLAGAGAFGTCEGARQPGGSDPSLPAMISTHAPPRMRLLLADSDHEFFAKIILLLDDIAPRRFVLEWASTYGFAVSLMRRHRFDLCLASSRIGHRSGSDLVPDIKAFGCETPVILLASSDEMCDPPSGQSLDWLDRNRLSPEMLRQAIRDASFRRGAAGMLPVPPVEAGLAVTDRAPGTI